MRKSKLLNVMGVSILAFLLLLCKKEDVLRVKIEAPPVETAFVVQIFDAQSGELIGLKSSSTITVEVSGPDKILVTDIFGRQVSKTKTSNGILSLAVSSARAPSANNPIDFVLNFASDGYLRGSLPIRIASTGGHSFIARLVNTSNPPVGVTIFEQTVGETSIDGTVQHAISAQTAGDTETQASTSVYIPAGTRVSDRDNQPLNGSLTFQIAYYSNQSDAALDCFPGSFCVKTEQNSVQSTALFISGGWADYLLTDEAGRTAANFSQPITISIDVPSNTFNPETKQLIRAGDYFPIWDYRFSDGVWVYEDEGLLHGPDANGNFFISYETDHLSRKNVDKETGDEAPVVKNIRRRNETIQELLDGDYKQIEVVKGQDGVFGEPNNIRFVFREANTGFIYWSSGYLNSNNDQIYLPDAPCNFPTIIEVWGGCPYTLWGQTEVSNFCGDETIEIALNNPGYTGGQVVNVEVTVYANCSETTILPNISAFYDDGCGWKYIGQVETGFIMVPGLEIGKGYSFGVWIDDNWFEEFFVIEETSYTWNVELPESICSAY